MLPYEKDDLIHVSITLEVNLNAVNYSRSRYTAFDLLSDVGGLSGMFASIFAVIMIVWNYNALDYLIVSHLFKMQSDTSHANDEEDRTKNHKYEKIKDTFYPNLLEYAISWLPACLVCCKKSRINQAREMAAEKLALETSLVYIVRQQRYFSTALENLIAK